MLSTKDSILLCRILLVCSPPTFIYSHYKYAYRSVEGEDTVVANKDGHKIRMATIPSFAQYPSYAVIACGALKEHSIIGGRKCGKLYDAAFSLIRPRSTTRLDFSLPRSHAVLSPSA